MADTPRTSLTDRAAALLVGPFLLGRRALDMTFLSDVQAEAPPPRPQGLAITSPEHAIKRRG